MSAPDLTPAERLDRLVELLTEARTVAGSMPIGSDHMALVVTVAQAKALALMLRGNA